MKIEIAVLATALTASLCTAASAQTSVTLYGLIDAAAVSYKGEPTGVKSSDPKIKALISGGMSTSHWGLKGSEDLGDGLSAFFELSSFLRVDLGQSGRAEAIGAPVNVAADPFWSRVAFVGLRGRSWGSLRLGNVGTPLFLSSITSNAFGDSMTFSPIQLTTFVASPLSGGTAWTNSAIYDSANWSGLSFSLIGSLSENQGGRNTGGRVNYAQGGFSTSLAWQNVKKNPSTFADGLSANNTKAWQLAAMYDFKVVKVYSHLGNIQNKGTEALPVDVSYRIWDLSAAVPIGSGNVLVGYADRKTSDAVGLVPASVNGGNVARQVFSLAYDHYLSKRTDVYALYSQDKTVTNTLPAPGRLVSANGNAVAIGIRHRF